MRIRVTVLSPHFPPVPGGLADYTRLWCEAMLASGTFDLTVITAPGAQALEGVAVVPTQEKWDGRSLRRLRRAVERSAPDVIVLQYIPHAFTRRGAGLPGAWLASYLSRTTGVPLVTNAHELYAPWSEQWFKAPWNFAQRLALLLLVRDSAALVVTVRARQARLRSLVRASRARIHLIPIGANIPPSPATEPAEWRRRHGVPEQTLLLASFGLGHWSQDVEIMSRALDRLEEAGIDATLFLAGKLDLAHPHARSLGFLPLADVAAMLTSADLFMLPLVDGVSGRRTSVISALAAGAPVLSTAGSDTDFELFVPQALRLVPAGDADAFCSAAIELAGTAELRAALGREGRRLYEREFAWDVIAGKWSALLRDVVAPSGRTPGSELAENPR